MDRKCLPETRNNESHKPDNVLFSVKPPFGLFLENPDDPHERTCEVVSKVADLRKPRSTAGPENIRIYATLILSSVFNQEWNFNRQYKISPRFWNANDSVETRVVEVARIQ